MRPPTVSSIIVFTVIQRATQDLLRMKVTAISSPKSGGDTLLRPVMMFVYTTQFKFAQVHQHHMAMHCNRCLNMASVQDSIAKQATHMALSQVISLCTRVSGSPQGYLAGAFFDNRTAFSVIIQAPLG